MKNINRYSRWVYGLLISLMFGTAFVPGILEYMRQSDRATEAHLMTLPESTADELLKKHKAIKARFHEPASEDPEEYFRIIAKYHALQEHNWRYIRVHGELPWGIWPTYPGMVSELQQRYRVLHGDSFGTKSYPASVYGPMVKQDEPGHEADLDHGLADGHKVLSTFFWWYLLSIGIAFVYFSLRIKEQNDASFWAEVFGQLLVAVILWPYKIWSYPTRLLRDEQIKRLKKIWSYIFSAFIPVFSIYGVAKADTRSKRDEGEVATVDSGVAFGGYGKGVYRNGKLDLEDVEVSASFARPWGTVSGAIGPADLYEGNNWLRTLNAQIGRITFGRIVTAGGGGPGTTDLQAIPFPTRPFGVYGTGIQVNGKFGGLDTKFDVTGGTDLSFSSGENFDSRIAVSAQLSKSWEASSVSLTGQVEGSEVRVGLEGSGSFTSRLFGRFGLFGKSGEDASTTSAFGFLSYLVDGPWHVHAQVDTRGEEETEATAGISWRPEGSRWSAIFDASHKRKVAGRLQFAF